MPFIGYIIEVQLRHSPVDSFFVLQFEFRGIQLPVYDT